jgi:hypothetical protein
MREQHDLAVGKLQRIMVRAGVVHVHLPEPCNPVRQRFGPPEQKLESGEMTLDLVLEGDLGARKETDGYPRSSNAEKPRVVVFQNWVVTSLSPLPWAWIDGYPVLTELHLGYGLVCMPPPPINATGPQGATA